MLAEWFLTSGERGNPDRLVAEVDQLGAGDLRSYPNRLEQVLRSDGDRLLGSTP